MDRYHMERVDSTLQTPRTTRFNRQRRRQDISDDASDSSMENERWRNNYPVVKAVLNVMDEEYSESESSGSLDNENELSSLSNKSNSSHGAAIPIIANRIFNDGAANFESSSGYDESNSSHGAAIPVIANRSFSDGSINSELEDQLQDVQRRNLRERLIYEHDDEYASEDELMDYQHDLENGVDNVQNQLQDLLMGEDAADVINAHVNISKAEILLAVLKFSLIYNLPQSAISDLFKMLNIFFSTTCLPDSRYLVDKLFNCQDDIEYHAICPNCKSYVKQFNREEDYYAHCDPCNLRFSLKSPTYTEFFSIINPKQDITHYLEEHFSHYETVVEARANNNIDISDFHSGLLYRKLRNSLPDDKKDTFVTATFNTDGSPVFESSSFSIWPIQIIINELPFKKRISKAILCGLWYGKNKPDMNIFLRYFVNHMNLLSNEGITCNIRNIQRKFYVYAVCSCDDSVARAPMQGLTQYNGHYGCNWCLHPGYYVFVGRGGCVKYILMDDVVDDRNETDSLRHIRESVESGRTVYGFMKESVLTQLDHFNITSGFVPDSMHLIDLGIAKQFMKYWFDTRNMPYSLNNEETDLIDHVLKNFKVPGKALRHSRSLRDRKFWKAKELQNWVLYYSTVVLLMIPRMRYYVEHWINLVKAYHILLQNNISREQIREANRLLNKFVALTELYYGTSAMTFNVHQLLHLAQSVINWGPLHCHSGYAFENGNGQIVKQVQAANGVIHQINRIVGMKTSALILKKFMTQNNPDSVIIDYVSYLETRICTKVLKTEVGRYFGKVTLPNHRWIRQLNLSDSAVVYKKLVKSECTYLSCNKIRLRSNNNFARTLDNSFIQIVHFIIDNENRQEYSVCKRVNIANIFDNNIVHNFQIKIILDISEGLIAIPTTSIDKICVYMQCNNESYLCPVPNSYSY